jgi:hypothetical protein
MKGKGMKTQVKDGVRLELHRLNDDDVEKLQHLVKHSLPKSGASVIMRAQGEYGTLTASLSSVVQKQNSSNSAQKHSDTIFYFVAMFERVPRSAHNGTWEIVLTQGMSVIKIEPDDDKIVVSVKSAYATNDGDKLVIKMYAYPIAYLVSDIINVLIATMLQ